VLNSSQPKHELTCAGSIEKRLLLFHNFLRVHFQAASDNPNYECKKLNTAIKKRNQAGRNGPELGISDENPKKSQVGSKQQERTKW